MSTRKPHTKEHRREPKGEPRRESRTSTGGAYWLYGTHAVEAALNNPARRFERMVALPQAQSRFPKAEKVEGAFFEKTFGQGAVHQGIAALVKPLQERALHDVLKEANGPLVLLDQVTDPHNAGAILRSAAAFDAAAVICPKDHAPPEGAILAKSASGALEVIPFLRVTNLVQAIEEIKKAGYWVAGLDGAAAQTIPEAKLTRKTALVMGAEGTGLRRLTREHCDYLVKLPINPRMESLNVSNAAAVALYAIMQQPG